MKSCYQIEYLKKFLNLFLFFSLILFYSSSFAQLDLDVNPDTLSNPDLVIIQDIRLEGLQRLQECGRTAAGACAAAVAFREQALRRRRRPADPQDHQGQEAGRGRDDSSRPQRGRDPRILTRSELTSVRGA